MKSTYCSFIILMGFVLTACGSNAQASEQKKLEIPSDVSSVCYSFETKLDKLGQEKGVRYNTNDAISVCEQALTNWVNNFSDGELPSTNETLTQYGNVSASFQAAEDVRYALLSESVTADFIDAWQGNITDILMQAIVEVRN